MLQWAILNSDSNHLTHPNSIVLRHVLAMWPCCDMHLRIKSSFVSDVVDVNAKNSSLVISLVRSLDQVSDWPIDDNRSHDVVGLSNTLPYLHGRVG